MALKIPLEVQEMVVDGLRDDRSSLHACSLVCKSWLPRSRHQLFSNLQPTIVSVTELGEMTGRFQEWPLLASVIIDLRLCVATDACTEDLDGNDLASLLKTLPDLARFSISLNKTGIARIFERPIQISHPAVFLATLSALPHLRQLNLDTVRIIDTEDIPSFSSEAFSRLEVLELCKTRIPPRTQAKFFEAIALAQNDRPDNGKMSSGRLKDVRLDADDLSRWENYEPTTSMAGRLAYNHWFLTCVGQSIERLTLSFTNINTLGLGTTRGLVDRLWLSACINLSELELVLPSSNPIIWSLAEAQLVTIPEEHFPPNVKITLERKPGLLNPATFKGIDRLLSRRTRLHQVVLACTGHEIHTRLGYNVDLALDHILPEFDSLKDVGKLVVDDSLVAEGPALSTARPSPPKNMLASLQTRSSNSH